MNTIFRNIKENDNLDLLEESDDVTMTSTSSTTTSIDDTSITKNKQKEGYINRTSELLDGNNTRCQDIVYPRSEWLSNQLEIVLNPKVKQYSTNNKIYPKGRSTMGLPGTRAQKGKKKWKQIK